MDIKHEGTVGTYVPAATFSHDSDCVEYVKKDALCLYERVDEFLTLIKDADDHALVGFKLKGFRHTINKLSPAIELSDRQFLALVSVIEEIFTSIGASVFNEDGKRKAAYQLAANDNVRLREESLLLAA
jgi:hypothetical protein